MILYFSATGNTKFIAEEIAKRVDDETVDLLNRIKEQDYSEIYSEKPFVVCSPVHVCEMPRFLAKYLLKLPLTGNPNIYFVFTSGGYAGVAAALGRKMAKKKGMVYMGRAEFTMPRNYPVSRRYPLLPEDKNIERIRKAYSHVPEVAENIKNGVRIKVRRVTYFEKIITYPFNPIWVKYMHSAKPFYSTDRCIGCGKCVRLCPLNNIRLEDRRPKWEESCAHCMACLANCPVEAIEYGKITTKTYKYRFDKYWKDEKSPECRN